LNLNQPLSDVIGAATVLPKTYLIWSLSKNVPRCSLPNLTTISRGAPVRTA
jgi:hypothetical protein